VRIKWVKSSKGVHSISKR